MAEYANADDAERGGSCGPDCCNLLDDAAATAAAITAADGPGADVWYKEGEEAEDVDANELAP